MHTDINMPIDRYMTYNRYLMIDAGIGGDLESFDTRVNKLFHYIKTEDKANAQKELLNLRQAYHFVIEETNPEFASFVALIQSIDGKPLNDLTDENVKRTVKMLGKRGLLVSVVRTFLKAVKKNLEFEMALFFPDNEQDDTGYEYFNALKKRALLVLDGIASKEDTKSEVEKVDDFIYSLFKPRIFHGAESVEVSFINGFADTCAIMDQYFSIPSKSLSVLDFFRRLKLLEKQLKPKGHRNGVKY